MGRKDNIIKHLKMMGYAIHEYGEFVDVYLKTSGGYVVTYRASVHELIGEEHIVERIVGEINSHIVSVF